MISKTTFLKECDHCGMDLDPYCVQPDVTGIKYKYGLVTRQARDKNGVCGPEAKYWEPRKTRTLPMIKS